MMRAARHAGAALTLLLAGCGSLLPVAGPPPNLYSLTPKSTFGESLPTVDWQLIIEEPIAAGGLDSSQIALRPSATALKYFADSRWTERAPKMVQTLLVESFENTRKIVAVGRQAIGLRSDFNLKTELREFQAEYYRASGSAPTVRVRINAKLVTQPRQVIVASHSFESTVEAEGGGMTAIIAAFDQALGKVIRQLVEWTLITGSEAWPTRS